MFMLQRLRQAFTLLLISLSFSLFSQTTQAQSSPSATTPSNTEKASNKKDNSIVILETNRGQLTLELFDTDRPKTVKNFLRYVKEGFYNDTVFHRVIPNFVIQGGAFTKELAKKKTHKPIKNESSKDLENTRGSIAMTRLSSPNSASSQFFINLKDNRQFNYREYNPGYAVFGRIKEGMKIVDNIAKTKTGNVGMFRDVPIDAVIIKKAYLVTKSTSNNVQPVSNETNSSENSQT